MSERSELVFKFIFLLSGLALFVALVYGGTQRETEPVKEPAPSPSPTQTVTPTEDLTPKE